MPLESIIIISLLAIILLFLIYLVATKEKKQETPPLVIQTHLTNLQQAIHHSSQTLTQINTILLSPLQRGHLGNTQLEHLLSLYLPNDGKSFQLEYRLKKPTGKGGFLIADAFLFGLEGKNNLAIDSKFPLENYLLLNNQSISELEKKEAIKNFKSNLKEHIKKVSEYISEEDHCPHALVFFPSEAIFAKIQEADYADIRNLAMEKKVSLCSPITLAIIINQIL
jgi:DNA recombination protein RmuC